MINQLTKQTMENLITAFSYKLTLETNFYWKVATNSLVEVSIFDYALVSECKENYNSGLDKEEEREVKEAIIAIEKKRTTHLFIPRISVDERTEIMNKFILTINDIEQKNVLKQTLNRLIELSGGKPINLIKNGFKIGFDLNDLTLNAKELSPVWSDFCREEIRYKVHNWLNTINVSTLF